MLCKFSAIRLFIPRARWIDKFCIGISGIVAYVKGERESIYVVVVIQKLRAYKRAKAIAK